jgi:hypothetical protein
MAIIRALPHSFDDVVRTISILDKFDKPSVIQSLQNMDQTRTNLSSTTSVFATSSSPFKRSQTSPSSPSGSVSTPSSFSSPNSQNRGSNCPKCEFCSHLGHLEAKCFLKEKLMRPDIHFLTSHSIPCIHNASEHHSNSPSCSSVHIHCLSKCPHLCWLSRCSYLLMDC